MRRRPMGRRPWQSMVGWLAGSNAARIWFKKCGGDLGPSARLPALAHTGVLRFARSAAIRAKLALLFRIRLRRKPNPPRGCHRVLGSSRRVGCSAGRCAAAWRVPQRRDYSEEGVRCRSCSAACTTASGAMPAMQARSGLRQRALKQGEQGASFARITTLAPP